MKFKGARKNEVLTGILLQLTLPEINQAMKNDNNEGVWARWVDHIGEKIVSMAEIEISGERIDRIYGDWIHIRSQLSTPAGKRDVYDKLIGNVAQLTKFCAPGFFPVVNPLSGSVPCEVPRNALPETTIYVQLPFGMCTTAANALPIGLIGDGEVRLNLDLTSIEECLVALASQPSDETGKKVTAAYQQSLVAASVLARYGTVDRLHDCAVRLPITTLEASGSETVGSSSNELRLNMAGRYRELIWVVQSDRFTDYESSLASDPSTKDEKDTRVYGAQPFNYTDAFDIVSREFNVKPDEITSILPFDPDTFRPKAATFGRIWLDALRDLHSRCWGQNPVVTAKLKDASGKQVFAEREGTFFGEYVPWNSNTNSPTTGINAYSFVTCPDLELGSEASVDGILNGADLQLVLSNESISGTRTAKVRVYGTRARVLEIHREGSVKLL